MITPQLTSAPSPSTATRARRGAAAVIAQYIQDLSGARSSLSTPVSATVVPCAS